MATSETVRRITTDLLDWFFPPLCASCEVPLAPDAEDFLCPECRPFLNAAPDVDCSRCSVVKDGSNHACPLCSRLPAVFDSLTAGYFYRGTAGRLVRSMKFRGGEHLAPTVARLLVGVQATRLHQLVHDVGVQVIVPAPMHPWRRLRKGFNQAEALAGQLSRLLGLPTETNAIERVRRAPPQARTASVEERIANVRGVFAPVEGRRLDGRSILLVDDVLTTGATAAACAAAAREAGASQVHILAFARAGLGEDGDGGSVKREEGREKSEE